MKKIYIFFLIIFSIFSIFFIKNDVFYDYFSKFPECKFCYSTNNDCQNNNADSRTISVNGKSFVYFSGKSISNYNAKYKHVFIKGNEGTINKICNELNITIKEEEIYEDKKIYFGYSPAFAGYIWHGKEKINFQFVEKENEIVIGSPHVYISF